MSVKVFYKSPIVWNMILYCIFSMAFIYFQNIYSSNSSIMDKNFYLLFLKSNWAIGGFVLLTVLTLLNDFKKVASMMFSILIFITVSLTIYYLFLDFTKMPIVLLFFYILFGFYLLQFYDVELEESYYNPLFKKNDLFEPSFRDFEVKIYKDDKFVSNGVLTNWSEEGCFIRLDDSKSLRGKYLLEVHYEGHKFTEFANLVCSNRELSGHGFKFKHMGKMKKLQDLGWNQFYEIIDEMGYTPELLR